VLTVNGKVQPPTIFVIFGATGDLVSKKIAPALYHLADKNKLPKFFNVVGFSRQTLLDKEFKNRIRNILLSHKGITETKKVKIKPFLNALSYVRGDFQNKSAYQKLAYALKKIDDKWGVCANKLFYLAVPPKFYEPILKNLAASGLTKPCSDEEGWTRVIVEKPFGKDLKTARELDSILGSLFKEKQVYRIDHYLAKEMLQNILSFRFSNALFQDSWSSKFIHSIDIKLWESIGVEDRGAFYDGVGALRDVGQNHLLQMLALTTMEHPLVFKAKEIRSSRAALLKTLKTFSAQEIKDRTFRSQYKGYRKIQGVGANSQTETYFKIRGFLNHPEWSGVPITMESGKRMGSSRKEIAITFKHPTPCLCPAETREHYKNIVVFSLEPKEGIEIVFWSKKPGLEPTTEKRALNFRLRSDKSKTQYVEEYEKLLLDCIRGDQTLFVSTEEVKEMWRFIDPIIVAWNKNKVMLENYQPDTDATAERAALKFSSNEKEITSKGSMGIIGLGKMGKNIADRLSERGWEISGYDKTTGESLEIFLGKLPENPKLIWLMVPHKAVDEVIKDLVPHLKRGDTIIDGGNSFYKDSIRRGKKLDSLGIKFLDVGVSGGPGGAKAGASLMIGGNKQIYEKLKQLWEDLAVPDGYGYMGKTGAGHFVKMVHNGIEYGMMQALAEGFAVMKKSKFKLNLKKAAEVYSHGSVIESRLVEWLKTGYEKYGENLSKVSGSVAQSGEGKWTVKTAKEFGVPLPVIKEALNFRLKSQKHPSYTGKILSALRNQFGGHNI